MTLVRSQPLWLASLSCRWLSASASNCAVVRESAPPVAAEQDEHPAEGSSGKADVKKNRKASGDDTLHVRVVFDGFDDLHLSGAAAQSTPSWPVRKAPPVVPRAVARAQHGSNDTVSQHPPASAAAAAAWQNPAVPPAPQVGVNSPLPLYGRGMPVKALPRLRPARLHRAVASTSAGPIIANSVVSATARRPVNSATADAGKASEGNSAAA
eukprot:scpid102744/ scgid33459/ 